MPMSRHLIAFALVLLLPACATTGAARTASPATASASTSPPAAPPHDPQLHAAPPQAPALPSPVVVPLDAATLASLPRVTVTATAHGETLQCEGVALAALMQRSEEHTSELQSLMRISYAVFCLKNKNHMSIHTLSPMIQ